MMCLTPSLEISSTFSCEEVVAITVPPFAKIIWLKTLPVPPAAACTSATSPGLMTKEELIK